MPSVRKIAKKANVSIATVSRALNDSASVSPETKKRVLAAVNEAQYFNAVGKRVTTNVGLVFTSTSDFYAFDALLMAGILRGLAEQNSTSPSSTSNATKPMANPSPSSSSAKAFVARSFAAPTPMATSPSPSLRKTSPTSLSPNASPIPP